MLRMTIADDVAMSIQLASYTASRTIHVANAISRSDDALVQELTQPAIHGVHRQGGGGGLVAVVAVVGRMAVR